MLRYILKRLVMLIPVILVTSFLIFWAMSLTGGDPALMLAGDNAKPEQIEQIREELGLNDPFIVRYGNYMKGMITGDMGQSYVTKRDVFKTFMERLPNTLMLGGAAVLIAVAVSLPLGIYTAIHQNTWKDTAGMIFALFGTSMPNFWLGLMLIILFSLKLGLFPTGGKGGLDSLVLPAVTVGFGLAALSPVIFDYEVDVIGQNMQDRLMGPCAAHWFGTDEYGRDLFARVVYGARYSLIIGVGSVALGLIVGTILGSQAGFHGGVTDSIIMRGIDIFYSIPNIMTAVVIVSLLGPSTVNLMIALAFSCASSFARIVRASVMTIRDQEYVESSYAMGLPTWKIIVKHILPNCLSPIIVQITLLIGTTIISASSLSFLGIGVPAPAPEWGALLSAGRGHIRDASYMCIIPGLAIMFTVLALNLLGDGLRDALDPKLKK